MRTPIHEPYHLWRHKKKIWRQLRSDMSASWASLRVLCRCPKKSQNRHLNRETSVPARGPARHGLVATLRLIIDVLALMTLLAGIIISPPLVVAFICWIEWYIRNDGSTNETINQVGQWSPLVSVAVVLFAALVYQLKGKLASADEIRDEIWRTEMHLRKLRGQLEEKNNS